MRGAVHADKTLSLRCSHLAAAAGRAGRNSWLASAAWCCNQEPACLCNQLPGPLPPCSHSAQPALAATPAASAASAAATAAAAPAAKTSAAAAAAPAAKTSAAAAAPPTAAPTPPKAAGTPLAPGGATIQSAAPGTGGSHDRRLAMRG